MSGVVLDASALLAFLKGEAGGTMVKRQLVGAHMSSVNLAEVASTFVHAGMPPDEVETGLRDLPLTIVPLDAALAYRASALRAMTAAHGLSLGDRCCLALAHHLGLPALTCDRAWMDVAEAAGVKVKLAR
ncbi:type II toxin-antitoxin system VapC family toxin [Porphyrobacter sp. GA68]|uniref:type II toxin-antitoxin system VapC family toxin n=1 Tax=Porphyrobacter sp. GA68 TaxID=2883480 RepID=UPI001D18657F|nr:type II toxin-antitoxin system VapC family toxin [Porphyrobacter sp. GA68]